MIIHIALTPLQMAAIPQEQLILGLSALMRAHRLGHHLVVAERDSAQWILDHIPLGAPDLAMIRSIGHQFTQNGALLESAKYLIRVDICPPEGPHKFDRGVIVPIEHFSDARLAEPAILLVEDTGSDGLMYKFILECLKPLHQCKNLSFDILHGGGDRITKVFEEQLASGRMIACVVDSDRCAPCNAPPTKVVRLRRAAEEAGSSFTFVCNTPGREVENFIPLSVYLELKSDFDKGSSKNLLRIQKDEHPIDELDRFWFFFDVKKGICSDDLPKILDDGWRSWIETRLSLTLNDLEDFRIAGFGEKVLAHFLDSQAHLAKFHDTLKTNEWRLVFWAFFDQLLWILFGGRRQVT